MQRIVTLLLIAIALQGCGNKGPLFLPPDQSASPPANNQPPERRQP